MATAGAAADYRFLDVREYAERVAQGRKMIDTLWTVMRDLIRLESYVAAELKGVAAKMQVPASERGSCMDHIFTGLRAELTNRAAHSRLFVDSLQSDLSDKALAAVCQNHAEIFAQVKRQITHQETALRTLMTNYRECLADSVRFSKASLLCTFKTQTSPAQQPPSQDTPQASSNMLTNILSPSRDRNPKHFDTTLQAIGDMLHAENRLEHARTEYNDYLKKYTENKVKLAETLVDLDVKRMTCIRDMSLKLLVHRMATIKNQEYDVQLFIKGLDESNVIADLDQVVQGFIRTRTAPSVPNGTQPVPPIVQDETTVPETKLTGTAEPAAEAVDDPAAVTAAAQAVAVEKPLESAPAKEGPTEWAADPVAVAVGQAAAAVEMPAECTLLFPEHMFGGSSTPPNEAVGLADEALYESPIPPMTVQQREAVYSKLQGRSTPRNHPFDNIIKGIELLGHGPQRFRRTADEIHLATKSQSWAALKTQLTDILKAPVLSEGDSDLDYSKAKCIISDFYSGIVHGLLGLVRDNLDATKVYMSQPRLRLYLCELLMQSMDDDNQQAVRLKSEAFYAALCVVILAILDWAEVHHDAYIARSVVLLSSRFYYVGVADRDPKDWNKTDYLTLRDDNDPSETECTVEGVAGTATAGTHVIWRVNRGIYQHRAWNRVSFWEEILVLALSEHMQKQLIKQIYGFDTAIMAKYLQANPLADSVLSLPEHLVYFGISANEVRALVRRICERYSLPNQLTEQLIKNVP